MKLSHPKAVVELAGLGRALGHPARVRLLRLLLDRGICQCAPLVDELGLAQSTVSQHLKIMREAGLISGTIDGPRTCYCVNHETVEQLKALVGDL